MNSESDTDVLSSDGRVSRSSQRERSCVNRLRAIWETIGEAVPRAVAFFFAVFSLLNIIGELRHPGFDANIWWIDLSPLSALSALSATVARGLLLVNAVMLLAFAWRPPVRLALRLLVGVTSGLLTLVALWNAAVFYRLVFDERIESSFLFPLSFLVAMGLLLVVFRCWKPAAQPRTTPTCRPMIGIVFAMALLGLGVGFPVCQMLCFGKTDYRQAADVAVVLGCRAYADGEPSAALFDRVRTGCLLYLDGTVSKLVFSGGPGDGDVHETESMRRLAMSLGVPDADIILDAHGLSTQETADNSTRIIRERGFNRVLAVSHFYHMPRIKLCFRRAGVAVRTVPCEETYVISQLGYCMAREVAALWLYYFRPLAG